MESDQCEKGAKGSPVTKEKEPHLPAFKTPSSSDSDRLVVHPGTAYNAALVCIAVYFIKLSLDDLRDDGEVSILHWQFLARCFAPDVLLNLFALWLACNAGVLVTNAGFRCWRAGRACLNSDAGCTGAAWDWCWVLLAVLHHTVLVVVPAWASYRLDLPASATCALCFEQVRLLMKSLAYLAEHVRGTLADVPTNDDLSHLLYYMFAPTLEYWDRYDRSARVRVRVVLLHSVLFLVTLVTMVVVAGRGALRPFCAEDASLLHFWDFDGAWRVLFQYFLIVVRAGPAGAVLVLGTSQGLHHWNKVFAELLRFPARDFTRDWWNAKSYAIFLRDWNQFVKKWLHKYVYSEMMVRGYSRHASRMTTVAVSAFWHEYILAVSLGYVIPFIAVLYVLGAAIVFPDPLALQKRCRGNLFVLHTMAGGVASILAFYFMESTARLECPQQLDTAWDLFVPRSLNCEQLFKNCTFM